MVRTSRETSQDRSLVSPPEQQFTADDKAQGLVPRDLVSLLGRRGHATAVIWSVDRLQKRLALITFVELFLEDFCGVVLVVTYDEVLSVLGHESLWRVVVVVGTAGQTCVIS